MRIPWLSRVDDRRWVVVLAFAVLLVVGAVAGVVALAGGSSGPGLAAPVGTAGPDGTGGLGTGDPGTTAQATGSVTVGATTIGPTTAVPPKPPVSTSRTVASSAKKGVTTWGQYAWVGSALRDVGVRWYWNWDAKPTPNAGTVAEFVPQIWGAGAVNAGNLDRAKSSGKALLGFNEPDFADQSNMTVEQALDLWPQLQATGLRLGSPAPAVGGDKAGGWLDRFLAGVTQRGYRVDFIALHWYGGDFSTAAVNQLRGYLQAVWDRYHKPIWLTEFALIRWDGGGTHYPSDAQQVAFIQGATAMLQALSFVERYAWFALPTPDQGGTGTGLYHDGTATAAGAAYRSAG